MSIQDFITWEEDLLQRYTLEDLEANPELLSEIPEELRADYLRAFAEMQEIRARWQRLKEQAAADGITEADLKAALDTLPDKDRPAGDLYSEELNENDLQQLGVLYAAVLKRAREEQRPAAEVITEIKNAVEDTGTALQNIIYKKTHSIELTIDKMSTVFFNWNAPDPKKNPDGQMMLALENMNPVKYEKTGSPEITLYYNYGFDNDMLSQLNLKKKIDDEDYFILSYLYDAFHAGNRLLSPSKLYREMTGDDPNETQKTNLTNRLMKLATTSIFINDKEVKQAWDKNENETYKEAAMPLVFMRVGAEKYIASGKVVTSAIEILDEPEIFKIGRKIGQYTTVPKTLLMVKRKDGKRIRKTERYYKVLRYLLQNVARMKDPKSPRNTKILYSTFYKETGEKTVRDQQLAKDLLYTILDHFQREKWIRAYKEELTKSTGEVGVRIILPKDPTQKKIKKSPPVGISKSQKRKY